MLAKKNTTTQNKKEERDDALYKADCVSKEAEVKRLSYLVGEAEVVISSLKDQVVGLEKEVSCTPSRM